MFPSWRMKLREARLAFQGGRYEEASRLLASDGIGEFLPAKQLAGKVAAKFVARAEQRLALGDSLAGWKDLSAAGHLGGQQSGIDRLRHQYAARMRSEANRFLAAGDTRGALTCLEKLERRGLLGGQERLCRQLARLMETIERDAARGRLAEASGGIARAQALIPPRPDKQDGTIDVARRLQQRSQQMSQSAKQLRQLSGRLHAALESEDWSGVLAAADAILEIAPEHTAAKQARRQAWRAVGMDVTRAVPPKQGRRAISLTYGKPRVDQRLGPSTHRTSGSFEEDTVTGQPTPNRLLMWIDAVGGYLVCLDDQLILGQPTPNYPIALPILADLSRRHAVIRRDGGAYVLEPVQDTYVDGREVTGSVVLNSGQVIQLGDGVRIRFTKPHALSSTARLDIESHHKSQPSADGIILLADSCVLGPGSHCHVQARQWQNDVILYRHREGLMCRSAGPLSVDDQEVDGATELATGARVEGEDFAFSIEEV